jgi:uncharacterized protein (DUF433 family)
MLRTRDTFPMKSSVVTLSPNVMGGTPVFADTRVPVETFLEYLEAVSQSTIFSRDSLR